MARYLNRIGFTDCCFIKMKNFEVLGTNRAGFVPQYYDWPVIEDLETWKLKTVMKNENQGLVEDWSKCYQFFLIKQNIKYYKGITQKENLWVEVLCKSIELGGLIE
eukprot:UN24245